MEPDFYDTGPTSQEELFLVGPDGKTHELKPGSLILGRSASCDIVVDHPQASRRHAFLEFDGQVCVIYDEGSITGTFIEKQGKDAPESEHRVGDSGHPLKPGDRLRIGEVSFVLTTEPIKSDPPVQQQVSSGHQNVQADSKAEETKTVRPTDVTNTARPDASTLIAGHAKSKSKSGTSAPPASTSPSTLNESRLNNRIIPHSKTEVRSSTSKSSATSRPIFAPIPDDNLDTYSKPFDDWLGWTIATIIGWSIGWGVAWSLASFVTATVSVSLFGLYLAIPLGFTQAIALRKYVNLTDWWLLTSTGGLVGTLLGTNFSVEIATSITLLRNFWQADFLVLVSTIGLFIGVGQSFLLWKRSQSYNVGIWPLVSLVAAGAGFYLTADMPIWDNSLLNENLEASIWIAVVYGPITGICLVWILAPSESYSLATSPRDRHPLKTSPLQISGSSRRSSQGRPSSRQGYNSDVDLAVKTAVAASKSYFGAAFLTWILYYVGFYVIGLLVNLLYLGSANRVKRQTGINPSGRGCLQFLLFIHFWLPLLIIVVILVFGTHMGFTITDLLEKTFGN